jgi:hypothetical protein
MQFASQARDPTGPLPGEGGDYTARDLTRAAFLHHRFCAKAARSILWDAQLWPRHSPRSRETVAQNTIVAVNVVDL